jgi:hypothetical protein
MAGRYNWRRPHSALVQPDPNEIFAEAGGGQDGGLTSKIYLQRLHVKLEKT